MSCMTPCSRAWSNWACWFPPRGEYDSSARLRDKAKWNQRSILSVSITASSGMPPGRRQLFNHVYIGPFAQQTSRLHDQELFARRNRQRSSRADTRLTTTRRWKRGGEIWIWTAHASLLYRNHWPWGRRLSNGRTRCPHALLEIVAALTVR
ncbi:hypothetical protein CTRI78_v004464 [Colletotrichum trifolii]|uniref:Uncharacterized protein n=1 Tax=Colletotrichum trifolii TaxID=5466 RepID=A0A4R8RH23_COLTR|nr:hypothetical protein CTRI78_v004464 [Colletotrichum trifolii]